MIIDLIRHTTPEVAAGICYGKTDLPLTNSFEAEFESIQKKLMSSYDRIITSPLSRCAILAKNLNGKDLNQDKRIQEVDFGDWEMQAWDALPRGATQKWMDNFVVEAPPNGESLIQMQDRVADFWGEVKNHHNLSQIAVVTHAGVLRLIHSFVFDIPLTNIFRLKLNYGSIIRITLTETGEVLSLEYL